VALVPVVVVRDPFMSVFHCSGGIDALSLSLSLSLYARKRKRKRKEKVRFGSVRFGGSRKEEEEASVSKTRKQAFFNILF
jgi:hypothetical protein